MTKQLLKWLTPVSDIIEENNEISFKLNNVITMFTAFDLPNFGTHLICMNGQLILDHEITPELVSKIFLEQLQEQLETEVLGMRRFKLKIVYNSDSSEFQIINTLDKEPYHPNYLYNLKHQEF